MCLAYLTLTYVGLDDRVEAGPMGFHKYTLVARGANMQLYLSCVSAPPATNVDLLACFAERLFKN